MTDHELVEKYVDNLLDECKTKNSSPYAYAYALGNLEAKLGRIMFKLKMGVEPTELYTEIVDGMKERLK